jgi:hypothetical protein
MNIILFFKEFEKVFFRALRNNKERNFIYFIVFLTNSNNSTLHTKIKNNL